MPQAGKRHGMIKRTNSQIRKQRYYIMSKQDTKIVKSYMPYNNYWEKDGSYKRGLLQTLNIKSFKSC